VRDRGRKQNRGGAGFFLTREGSFETEKGGKFETKRATVRG